MKIINCLNQLEEIIDKEYLPFYKIPRNIPIHFYIIYTFPTIAGINIFRLSEEIKILNREMEELKRVNKKQNERLDRLDEKLKSLMNENKIKNDDSSCNYLNEQKIKFKDNKSLFSIDISENNLTNEIKEYDNIKNRFYK
mgnify:CR=1 FL=1